MKQQEIKHLVSIVLNNTNLYVYHLQIQFSNEYNNFNGEKPHI